VSTNFTIGTCETQKVRRKFCGFAITYLGGKDVCKVPAESVSFDCVRYLSHRRFCPGLAWPVYNEIDIPAMSLDGNQGCIRIRGIELCIVAAKWADSGLREGSLDGIDDPLDNKCANLLLFFCGADPSRKVEDFLMQTINALERSMLCTEQGTFLLFPGGRRHRGKPARD
jgi:hypothetical protein